MKIKTTLNMPTTDFSMKASLSVNEPKYQQTWYEQNYYQQRLVMNEGKKPFYLHDGPPYANGNIHTGHVLNKVLKDFIIRSKNMNGYYAPIVFGWDTHGLPIENAMLKKMKKKAEDFDPVELRKMCAEYAQEQVNNQKRQFFSLGLFADPTEDYLTLYHYFEQAQINVFNAMVKRGLIYQGLKPVYWSWSSKSALAEAEIEYQDVKSPAIYVGFNMIDFKYPNTQIVIWTTTPWTIPANEGISVGPDFIYDVIKSGDNNYIVAHDLIDAFTTAVGINDYEIIDSMSGSSLENMYAQHPLTGDAKLIMCGDHVTVESGTGCVHTAPGHGEDDFIVGKKYDIPVTCIVDENGVLNDAAGKYAGLFYDDANKVITQDLETSGHLLNLSFITHAYPHDWRTKKPVFYRATKQWFCNIVPIKDQLLNVINETQFLSTWGKVRLYNMLDNRSEWCISRQRKWGVPIPIFYAQNGEAIIDPMVIEHVGYLFSQHGSDVWFSWDVRELLPEGFSHPGSPDGEFSKELDIMDVWFDSGSSHHAVLNHYYGINQADLYLEGSDQYRGWFNSSLITSVALNDHAPYKKLVSHGFVLDGKGNKMSKSLGNVIEPKTITIQRGADILRLWVASVNYQQDVNLTDDLLDQVSESYRKIRNTIRFMLGNVHDFDAQMLIDFDQLELVDQFMLVNLNELTKTVIELYEEFDFTHIVESIVNYITRLLSGFYLDFIKDVIYVSRPADHRRRQIQSVLYHHIDVLLTLLTPIIPHTCYEAYLSFNNEVIFFKDFSINPLWNDYQVNGQSLLTLFNTFLEVREVVNKEIDTLRKQEVTKGDGSVEKVLGTSLKADVTFTPSSTMIKDALMTIEELKTLCIVHDFNIGNVDESLSGCGVAHITPLNGVQCDRCRQCFAQEDLVTMVEDNDKEVHVCQHCQELINNWSNDV